MREPINAGSAIHSFCPWFSGRNVALSSVQPILRGVKCCASLRLFQSLWRWLLAPRLQPWRSPTSSGRFPTATMARNPPLPVDITLRLRVMFSAARPAQASGVQPARGQSFASWPMRQGLSDRSVPARPLSPDALRSAATLSDSLGQRDRVQRFPWIPPVTPHRP